MSSEQSGGTITGLLGNIVDDTMTFVDDLLNRVQGLEMETRRAVSDVVDVRGQEQGSDDMANLEATLHDLQNRVQKLGAMKSKANSK